MQSFPATLAWLNGAAATGDAGVGAGAIAGAVAGEAGEGGATTMDGAPAVAGAPLAGARLTAPPVGVVTAAAGAVLAAAAPAAPAGRGVMVVVAVPCRPSRERTAYLSREVWQPEPPQSWPVWWLGLGRVHSVTPVLVFQVMPYSWQLSHFRAVTYACFMTVPEKLVNTVGEWHSSQAIVLE